MGATSVRYLCAECGKESDIKAKDAVRCTHCGYRILYKKRTWKTVQYEAR